MRARRRHPDARPPLFLGAGSDPFTTTSRCIDLRPVPGQDNVIISTGRRSQTGPQGVGNLKGKSHGAQRPLDVPPPLHPSHCRWRSVRARIGLICGIVFLLPLLLPSPGAHAFSFASQISNFDQLPEVLKRAYLELDDLFAKLQEWAPPTVGEGPTADRAGTEPPDGPQPLSPPPGAEPSQVIALENEPNGVTLTLASSPYGSYNVYWKETIEDEWILAGNAVARGETAQFTDAGGYQRPHPHDQAAANRFCTRGRCLIFNISPPYWAVFRASPSSRFARWVCTIRG